jgi:GT2 family glycosyltransferase
VVRAGGNGWSSCLPEGLSKLVEERCIWVGAMELATDEPVTPVSGPARADHLSARVLVRMHGAPLGYVGVPLHPEDTLPRRVRTAAESGLAESLSRHLNGHRRADNGGRSADWASQVTCPKAFRRSPGAGVSIVICTRDRPAGLQECLRSIQQVTYAPLEVLVVDNSPSDDATLRVVIEMAQDDPRIRYTCEPAPGLSNARNHGLAKAQFDLVAFTDDDVRVDPGWPAAMAAGFEADPEAACLTGLVASRSLETGPERYFDSRYPWGEAFEPQRYDLAAHRDPSRLYPFSAGIFGTGANFAVRRPVVERLGGFDPLLGAGAPARGGEDLDMFVRIILAGGRLCYLPSALIWHQHRADYDSLAEQLYSYGHGLGAYLAKRLMARQISATVFASGLGRFGVLAGRIRRASQASQAKTLGRRLAMTEARGILAGAHCYRRAVRQKRDQ